MLAALVNQSHLELIKTGSAHIDLSSYGEMGVGGGCKKWRHAPLLASNSQPNPDTPKPHPIDFVRDNFLLNHHHLQQAYLVVHDLPVGLNKALCIEGGFTVEHLVHADTQRPPVALRTVAPLACKIFKV